MEKEKTECQRAITAISNAIIVMMILTVLSMLMGAQFFGGVISIIGFALFALLFFAVR